MKKILLFSLIYFCPISAQFNPCYDDLYLSLTLFYGGLLMASNMIWAHELVHYFSMGHFNILLFLFGVFLSIFISIFILRNHN